MKNEKGLTLIELLATIVVIGIVSLIATPIVSNILKQSRKATFTRSVESINKIGSNYYISNSSLIQNDGFINFNCNEKECISSSYTEDISKQKLEMKGNIGNGYIKIYGSGEIEFLLSDGNYCGVKYPNKETVDIYDGNCNDVVMNSYIVFFDGNGGEVDTTSKVVVDGSQYGELPVPTRKGYRFIGWHILKDNGLLVDETTEVSLIQNQTLYAYWTRTGEAVRLGGYKWHVIGEYQDEQGRTLETLLMDANQLGDNSNMAHCTKDTDSSTDCVVDESGKYFVYSWDKSKIRTYLNSTFLSELENKITNEIVFTPICVDESRNSGVTYGRYLISELDALGKTSECTTQVSDKVRLISYSEYYNMTPYYISDNFNYPNVENITKISKESDYASWLYCESNICGNSNGWWWTLSSYSFQYDYDVMGTRRIYFDGSLNSAFGDASGGVRPVITIVK